jgi:hypothetical protein
MNDTITDSETEQLDFERLTQLYTRLQEGDTVPSRDIFKNPDTDLVQSDIETQDGTLTIFVFGGKSTQFCMILDESDTIRLQRMMPPAMFDSPHEALQKIYEMQTSD